MSWPSAPQAAAGPADPASSPMVAATLAISLTLMDWFMVGTRQLRQMIDGAGDTLPDEKSFGIALIQQRIGAHGSVDGGCITVQFHHHVGGPPNVGASNLGHNQSDLATRSGNPAVYQTIDWRAANTTIKPLPRSV